MNVYARTRDERLARVTEKVGDLLDAGHSETNGAHQKRPKKGPAGQKKSPERKCG